MSQADWPVVVVGPGDDCAVLRYPAPAGHHATTSSPTTWTDSSPAGSSLLLITVDHLIEGRHFAGPIQSSSGSQTSGTSIDAIARKAIARSVSDIAAMAGTPLWSLATAAFPDGFPEPLAKELASRLHAWGAHFGCPVVGGDIASTPTGTPVMLTVTVGGACHGSRGPVLRSQAKAGDLVLVTGRIGGSFTSGRHLTFEPRIREARLLADVLGPRLHAMMDVSDGLGADAAKLADASGLALELQASRFPLHAGIDAPVQAASDGEDYELLFTVDAKVTAEELRRAFAWAGIQTPVTAIGVAHAGQGCLVRMPDGSSIDARTLGWEHGRSDGEPSSRSAT